MMQPNYQPPRRSTSPLPWILLGCGGCGLLTLLCFGLFVAWGIHHDTTPPEAPETWRVFRSYVIRYDDDHGGATVRCPNCGGTGRKLNPYVGHEAPCVLCHGTGVWHGRFPELVILDDPR
jgi:hypothetical protein